MLAQGGGSGTGNSALLQAAANNPALLASFAKGAGSSTSGGLAGAIQNNPALQAAVTKGGSSQSTTIIKSQSFPSSNSLEPASVRILPPPRIISSGSSSNVQVIPTAKTSPTASKLPPPPPAPESKAAPPSKSPSGIDLSRFLKNPAVVELVTKNPEIVEEFNKASESGDLVGLLGNPVIAKFVQANPSVVSDFINGPSEGASSAGDTSISAALASLTAPPPAGAKEGIFGVDLFEGNKIIFQLLQ
jgi:hypothetical protein